MEDEQEEGGDKSEGGEGGDGTGEEDDGEGKDERDGGHGSPADHRNHGKNTEGRGRVGRRDGGFVFCLDDSSLSTYLFTTLFILSASDAFLLQQYDLT